MHPTELVSTFGAYALVAVLVIVFAECGLLVGFFLPGDSLLFMTGLFIADGSIRTPLWLACVLVAAAAVLGNAVGYAIGWRLGPSVFDKPESRLFRPKHVARTHEFFEKYGTRAIFLARFVPIVRTFITVMAGVGRMDRRAYFTASTIGGIVWGAGVVLLGHALGGVDAVKDNIELALVGIVLLSVIPIGLEWLRARRESGSVGSAG